MSWIAFASLFRKDLIEVRRSVGWFWIVIIGSLMGMEWGGLRNSLSAISQQHYYIHIGAAIVTQYLLLAAPLVIPQVVGFLLMQLHGRDQIRGSIIPVLCTGVRPGFVWIARLLAAFCAAYVVFLLSIGMSVAMIRVIFKLPVIGDSSLWIAILISAPLAALALPALAFLLSWISRTSMMVSSFLPMLIYLLGFTLYKMHVTMPKNPMVIIHSTAGLMVALIILFAILADRIPIARIVGLR